MTNDRAGFAERERLARAAWEFFSERDADEMTHQFRGGYHQGFIDGQSHSVPAEADEAMVERMARILFAQTTEARSGFTWPLNGERDRARDMERAEMALKFVLSGPESHVSAPERIEP